MVKTTTPKILAATGQTKKTSLRGASKKSVGPTSSVDTLTKLAIDGTKQYLHARKTTEAYDGYVKRGKEFLLSLLAGEQSAPGEGLLDELEDDENILRDPELSKAFDGSPNKSTPQAIAMFLAWKCFEQNKGIVTAEGVHAAFVAEYDQM